MIMIRIFFCDVVFFKTKASPHQVWRPTRATPCPWPAPSATSATSSSCSRLPTQQLTNFIEYFYKKNIKICAPNFSSFENVSFLALKKFFLILIFLGSYFSLYIELPSCILQEQGRFFAFLKDASRLLKGTVSRD